MKATTKALAVIAVVAVTAWPSCGGGPTLHLCACVSECALWDGGRPPVLTVGWCYEGEKPGALGAFACADQRCQGCSVNMGDTDPAGCECADLATPCDCTEFEPCP